jgi:hypothetical protein
MILGTRTRVSSTNGGAPIRLMGQLDYFPRGVEDLITHASLIASQLRVTRSMLELKRLAPRFPGHQSVRT